MQGTNSSNSREDSLLVTRVASLEAETDVAADKILDVSGVTEPQQVLMANRMLSLTFVNVAGDSNQSRCLSHHEIIYPHAGTFQLDQAVVPFGFHKLSGPQGMPRVGLDVWQALCMTTVPVIVFAASSVSRLRPENLLDSGHRQRQTKLSNCAGRRYLTQRSC